MSIREQCHLLIDELSDDALDELIGFMNELNLADDESDMEFCAALYDEALANNDWEGIST